MRARLNRRVGDLRGTGRRSWGALCILAAMLQSGLSSAEARSFHIDYSKRPVAEDLLAFELSILSPEAEVDLAAKQAAGGNALGYLSVVEIGARGDAMRAAVAAGVPMLGENAKWGSKLADVADPRWAKVVLEELAPAIVAKGFDGFFLDTADSVALLDRAQPERAGEFEPALIELIKSLHTKYPQKEIIINRGFGMLDRLGGAIDGVLIESVYRSFGGEDNEFLATAGRNTAVLEAKVRELVAAGTPVYAVDYVASGDLALAKETAERLEELGASALVTTPALDGVSLAPIRRELRRILVLYGWDESEKRPMWAIDTMTAERLQMPLEWMGYECEYLHVAKADPRASLAGHYAGVIFDSELEIPYGRELWYAEWAVRQKREGTKVLFAANFPFSTDDGMGVIAEGFDLRGSCETINSADSVEIVAIDEEVMNFEAKVRPHRTEFMDMRSPSGSQVMLTLRCKVEGRSIADYEPVFVAPWGGVLLDPYVTFMASPEHTMSLFDPFAFLGKIWPTGTFPVPDPTTRQGLRAFVSHIDGDGFASLSETKRDKLCAAVVRDRILKRFPLPVTVSVVEANTRACEKLLDPNNRERYEEVARSIFELPNVRAASHTYSHPYIWIPGDPDYQSLYDTDRLVMHDWEIYEAIDYRREIDGSIEYMERVLLPADKKVEILLWSGNCRPPAEAIRMVRERGIENMNGGDTIISARNNCLAAIAPRTMQWDDELQVFAPNQNEYVYTQDWRGPFYGGFAAVIDTFVRTESPRRLKPVNIYYHFYSAANLGSLRALERVHQWAMGQPLHGMTAANFAAMTRDSRATRLYQHGESEWTAVNEGHLRSFRVAAGLGVPDIARSEGVLGYNEEGDSLYVHTDGRQRVRIKFSQEAVSGSQLYLVNSSAETRFRALGASAARFEVGGVSSVSVVMGGAEPGSRWEVAFVGKTGTTVEADDRGRIEIEAPNGAKVTVSKGSLVSKD